MSSAQCYYPNGNPSTGDIPCGSGPGVACCPQGWSCEPNGLCHLPSPFYYGRYTCTDKTWKSTGCPNICTHSNTAAGAEAVIECSSGEYCCDANRPDALPNGSIDETKDCCHTSNSRFSLAQLPLAPGGAEDSGGSNNAAASSSTTSPKPASTTLATSSTSPTSSASAASTTSSISVPNASSSSTPINVVSTQSSVPASSTSNTPPATSIITSVITQNSGGSSTVITSTGSAIPAIASPSPTSTTTPSSNSKNHASIIAPAVAVPIAVLLLALLAFLLFRRRRRQHHSRASSPPPMADFPHPMYGPDAKDLVDSPYTGKSELEGSPHIIPPGTPNNGDSKSYHAPGDVGADLGAAGAQESKSELAASNSTMRSPKSRLSELHGSPSIDTSVDEGVQPAELQGNETQQQGGGYKAYRPPGLGLSE